MSRARGVFVMKEGMMRVIHRLGLLAAGAAFLVPATSHANHIAVSGLFGTPDAPGTGMVHFTHVEKESGLGGAGGPAILFGDGTIGYLDAISINQHTPPGTYQGDLYDDNDGVYLGPIPYTVSHAGEPPLTGGQGLNTEIKFDHKYSQYSGNKLFIATWYDCCSGAPEIPGQVPSPLRGLLQQQTDDVWYEQVQPAVYEIETLEPLGIDSGTTYVLAP
jgi:hypothetical protein